MNLQNPMFFSVSLRLCGNLNLGMGRGKREVLEDQEAMSNMTHLGQTIAWLGKGMAAAAETAPFQKLPVELD